MVDVISRQARGALYDDGFADVGSRYEGIYVHHSVTIAPDLLPPFTDDYEALRVLDRIGEQRFGGGMSYTWGVTPVGLLFQGHSTHRRGAHTGGLNSVVRAVCMVGDYSRNPPTAAQVQAIGELVRQEHAAGRSAARHVLGGHRDANRRTGRPATGCPGDAGQAALARINAVADGGTAQPTIVVPIVKPPAPAPRQADTIPYDFPFPRGHYLGTARRDSRCHSGFYPADRKHVSALQEGLRRRGWRITVDGGFGPRTAQVVAAFQREKRLAVDGLAGAATWAAVDRAPLT